MAQPPSAVRPFPFLRALVFSRHRVRNSDSPDSPELSVQFHQIRSSADHAAFCTAEGGCATTKNQILSFSRRFLADPNIYFGICGWLPLNSWGADPSEGEGLSSPVRLLGALHQAAQFLFRLCFLKLPCRDIHSELPSCVDGAGSCDHGCVRERRTAGGGRRGRLCYYQESDSWDIWLAPAEQLQSRSFSRA